MTMLTLHYHPLSSYCHKVLIALDELGITLEKRLLNLGDAEQREAYLALWPTGKMPLLVDAGQPIAESSIIIEYLQQNHAHAGRSLIPAAPEVALEVRLWDRLCDQYVMTPMQSLTADLLRPAHERDANSVVKARAALLMAYAMLEQRLEGRYWLAGAEFSMADCAAAPALFYAFTYVPLSEQHAQLAAYFERLLARPSVAAVIEQARPFFQYYPGRTGLAARFYDPGRE